jgi:DcuC family C4-dicarboxylate transporter
MPVSTNQLLGLVVIAAAVIAIARRVDVRLALFLAALAMATLAGNMMPVIATFFATLGSEQFVVPICSAMGFAHVLRQTGCDRHLIHLLSRPLLRVRPLLIPGAVLVPFIVNISVISQAGTAVAVGTVLVPLLRSAGLTPLTIAAALALGSSLGGEQLNPGAPEVNTIASRSGAAPADCVQQVAPVLMLQLAVAIAVFWPICLRAEARAAADTLPTPDETAAKMAQFRINPIKALVPIVPVLLLMVIGPPFTLISVPRSWLVDDAAGAVTFGARQVGASMLVGSALAALVVPHRAGQVTAAFFEGAGIAVTRIISIIVVANCFGEGIKQLHLDEPIRHAIAGHEALVWPLAGTITLLFALLCGSGMAATQSLYQVFVSDGMGQEMMLRVGSVVAVSAAAGRTMSPVAAVNLVSADLTDTQPLAIARRVALPSLIATAVTIAAAWWRGV